MKKPITKKREIKLDINNNESRLKAFETIFGTMFDGVAIHQMIYDKKNRPVDYLFLEINKSFEKIIGIKRKNILGKTLRQAIPGTKKDMANWPKKYNEIFEKKQPLKFEEYSEGLKKWFSVIAFPLEDSVFVTIFQDITKQKKTEIELQNSRDRFKTFLDNAEDLVQSVDASGKYTYTNNKWRSVLGHKEDKIKKMRFMQVIPKSELRHCIKIFQKLKRGQKSSNILTKFKKKNGEELIVEGYVNGRYDDKGKMIETIGIFKDKTKELAHEKELERLSKIANNSPALIIVTDIDGNIEYVNPKFTQTTGYKEEEVLGKNPSILKSGETTQKEYEEMWNTILSGKDWTGEFKNKRKNESTYWASATISPIKDKDGKIKNLIGIQEDITEKKRIEDEMKKFNDFATDRELRMVELKKEVNELLSELKKPAKYKIK